MSGPAGRVTRGAGKDTAGFGGGGIAAPPADMLLPLLRLRAPPPPPPASRLRLRGLAAAAAADPVRGVRACCALRGCGYGLTVDRAPPHHVGSGERTSALAFPRVTCTGAVCLSLSAHLGSSDPTRYSCVNCPPAPTCPSHPSLPAGPHPLSPVG